MPIHEWFAVWCLIGLIFCLAADVVFRRLEEAANRAKKMVSANLEAPFNIECLVDEFDIHGLLTRQGFEELCQPHSLRLTELLRTTFENSGASTTM